MVRSRFWITLVGCFGLAAALACLASVQAGGQKSDAEVKVNVEAAKPDAAGKQKVVVELRVNPGWHIYSNPVGNEDLSAAQTVISVSGKEKPASVKVDYPKGKVKKDTVIGTYHIYEGTVAIPITIERAAGAAGPLEVSVRFQACNEKGVCLFPATVRKTLP